MTTKDDALARIVEIVDSYHGIPHPAELGVLYELRRELSVARVELSRHVKAAYGRKALTYVQRKWVVAKSMSDAIKAETGKGRAVEKYKADAEALDEVRDLNNHLSDAEAAWEEVHEMLRSTDAVLSAMQQEITDARKEQDYQNHLELLQRRNQS